MKQEVKLRPQTPGTPITTQKSEIPDVLPPTPKAELLEQNIAVQPPTHAPCDVAFVDNDYTPDSSNYPFTTCLSYVVMDPKRNKILFSKKGDDVREMASLTKIMTAIVTLNLVSEMNIDMHKTWFKVSKLAAETIGTSACLIENQRVTVHDLLYGLMLPSGNDAAMTLAENFSQRLLSCKRRPGQKHQIV